jgi:hypothetical protein
LGAGDSRYAPEIKKLKGESLEGRDGIDERRFNALNRRS